MIDREAFTQDMFEKIEDMNIKEWQRIANLCDIAFEDKANSRFVLVSIMASQATARIKEFTEAMWLEETKGQGVIEDLTVSEYQDLMAKILAKLGHSLIQRFADERVKRYS